MSMKESALYSIMPDITPKVSEDIGFSLRSRDYKDAQIVVYRKSSHAKSKDDGQGWEKTETNDTLNIFDNGESRTPTLITQTVYDWHRQDTRMTECKDVCVTVAAGWGGGGNNMPYVLEEEPMAFENHPQDSRCKLIGDGQVNQPLSANMEHDPSNGGIVMDTVVRRLTPMECERLQGFPDGWTDIGEWTDSKGKKHKDADSPRYKALGNSIALPFWEWMAGRMCAYYDRPVEMASLFDGIGGFPLVYSRHGAIPVWASEIEEFPIAVTKIRFPEEEKNEYSDDSSQRRQGICDNVCRQTSQGKTDKGSEVQKTST